MSNTVIKNYYFPEELWRIIKEFAEINGKIRCQCNGYYLHTSKNTDGFAMYDYNTDKFIWCCKKYYESLYKDLYEGHSIWKYIFKEKKSNIFDCKFNYFNKNKKIILKYILLEKDNDFVGRRNTIETLMLDYDKQNNKSNKNNKNNKNKHKNYNSPFV